MDGNQRGIMPTDDALSLAREAGVDLVEVSPNERPPVCRIMDYGKHKYQQSKKQKEKHHEQRLKEIRIRPKTDPHDKGIKMKRAERFLKQGDRVQFTMMFRGRERFHREVGLNIFNTIVESLEDIAKLERPARSMGRRMTMVLVPLKSTVTKKGTPAAKKPGHSKAVVKPEKQESPSGLVSKKAAVAAGPGVPVAGDSARSLDSTPAGGDAAR